MASKRHKPEEMVQEWRQVDGLVGRGCRGWMRSVRCGITEPSYCRWRKQYGTYG